MRSYKNWKTLNESFIGGMTLGLAQPTNLGLRSNLPGISLSEKKMSDDDDCSCKGDEVKFAKKKCKKNMSDDVLKAKRNDPEFKKRKAAEVDSTEEIGKNKDSSDYAAKQSASMPGYKVKQNMKKKMTKHMEDEFDDEDMDNNDDDVNNVDAPEDDDDFGDNVEGEEDDVVGDEEEEDGEEEDGEEDDENDGEELEDDGEDAPKFGFMKDKKKRNMKAEARAFWEDINSNYNVPQEDGDTEEEFLASLSRQYGDPQVRFCGGVDKVNEDLLLSDEQQALIDAMPQAGEIGFSPVHRLGGSFAPSDQSDLDSLSYGESQTYEESVEESEDFEVLCKYFSEHVARELIEKKNRK